MEPRSGAECGRTEPEVERLEGEGMEAACIDDQEVEELHNSLKEVVQDPAVKPKLQCLMVDPSFSMVTVQSEDSGIVWETASSRCSTPWASEASSPSDAFSMEGSGTQGNIVIIMDEDKIKRRKKTSRGKLGDRFKRRLSGAAIGEERPAMIEVSVPNIRPENSDGAQSAEIKPDKDQELFNLISEGFEILNIVVPSKLPTVDEEDSTELPENLSYLEDSPKIKSKCKPSENAATETDSEAVPIDSQETIDECQRDSLQAFADDQQKKEETDLDYLEKFTLLDQNAPVDISEKPELIETDQQEKPQVPQEKEKVNDAIEDSFVIISDVEIASEHLDEVFYGASCHKETELPSYSKLDKKHLERQSSKTLKECGATLFGSQECILIPVYLPSGPPKIIDQDLLDEPRAMSFHYSDLYEDAVGDRKKDDDISDVESVVSEKSFKRRFSDSDDADGYLEKFILKDDSTVVEDAPEVDSKAGDRMIWPQNKFEMTGCLIRVKEEPETEEDGSQSELEGKEDAIQGQIEPPDCSKDCGSGEVMKTGCARGKDVSEALGDGAHCGTATGCAIAKVVSVDKLPQKVAEVPKTLKHETDLQSSVLKEHIKVQTVRTNKEREVELKHGRRHVPVGVVQDKVIKRKDEPQKHEETSNTTIETALQDGTEDIHKASDSIVKAEETVITKEEASDKRQQHKSKSAENVELDLVVKARKKDNSVSTTNEQVLIIPHEDVSQKEIHKDEKVLTSTALVHEKAEELKTTHSVENITVAKHEDKMEVTPALLPCASEIHENKQVHAVVDEVNIKNKMQEQAPDKSMALEVDDHVMIKSEATDIEVKSDLKKEATEELLLRQKDKTEKKVLEHKVKTEKTKQEKESTGETAIPSKMPERCKVPKEKNKIEDLSLPVGSLNEVLKHVSTTEKVLEEKSETTEKVVELKDKLPTSDNILEKKIELRELAGDSVSISTLQKETPVALSSMPSIPREDVLPAVTVFEEVCKKEKHELVDAILKESQKGKETKEQHAETVSLIPAAESLEDSSTVIVPNEVMHKQKDSEIRETIGKVPESVHPAAAVENDTEQELEGRSEIKSKKVLLKDTHKENIWRTLEPTTPPPPTEIQELSTMRVSPLQLPKYIREDDEDLVVEEKLKRGTGLFSTLRSFSPHEDLSGFGRETDEHDLNNEIIEDLGYEMVNKQEAGQAESEVVVGNEGDQELAFFQGKSAEQTSEASYEFIEDLEGTQSSEFEHLIEEIKIQPMDAFCLVCRCPILMSDGGHQKHEVSSLDKAFDDIKDQLSNWISLLQERSENIEDMVSELELAYNSVEEQCKDSEKAMEAQNEEVLKLVMDQYNEMSQTMEDEKKVKLEQLYDQIVSFQANIDSAKETMEKTTKEMDEKEDFAFVSSYKDIDARLKTALESTMSLELGPRGLLVFEDYAKGTKGNERKNREVIPVPQQPHIQPQEANSATSTSVTVYWTINEGDIIDCFQVYCMEEPQGVISEEYRVTVKESYCNLEDLEPDKCYKVWVMAVNYTGCSLPSERLSFKTAPSVPVIHPESCTVLWDSATIRWNTAQPSTVESFTLEYCRQYAMEGEGLRSVSGIKGNEHKVLLPPNENFLFYIKSVNAAGASEQSEAALISTRGTRFHLLNETVNPVLKVSEDRNSVEYPLDTYNEMLSIIECPAVMGEMLPLVGYHYWETVVAGCKAYRIGVAYQTAPKNSTVGDNSASWCLHCVPTSISCRFELLHENVESDIFVVDVPARIGTLLDFIQGRLAFFNAQNGQCLGSFQQSFTQPCSPVFVLESAGILELKMTTEVPEFAKHW
ncbi:cardiomyopathy-associated protein 5-like [Hoplias malabaricus]|uniref:cardiomyopathy-associated protein 5-like n=1 Tax=Hoplias malabaricus TaxID=27720 RepID=UPI003462856B